VDKVDEVEDVEEVVDDEVVVVVDGQSPNDQPVLFPLFVECDPAYQLAPPEAFEYFISK
jgi:hypothetical protein